MCEIQGLSFFVLRIRTKHSYSQLLCVSCLGSSLRFVADLVGDCVEELAHPSAEASFGDVR